MPQLFGLNQQIHFCASRDGTGCCPGGTTRQSGPGAARDDNGHGTNVAGVITSSGRVAPEGVAPDALILALKVLDKDGFASSTAQVLSGLDYVATQRPDVRVVNVQPRDVLPRGHDCAHGRSWRLSTPPTICRSAGSNTGPCGTA
jgi:subtilisin family serine protease